jgi:signal transduction histidine kinase/HAMP domain-containing protein
MARAASSTARRRGGRGTSLQLLFFAIACVIIFPFALLIAYFAYAQITGEKGRVQRAVLAQARTLATQIETHLTARIEGLGASAEGVAGSLASGGAVETQLRRLKQTFPDLGQVLAVDQFGAVIASVAALPESRRGNLADQAWFRRAATSTAPFPGLARQEGPDILVGLYAPVRAPDGQFRGAVAADLTMRRVQDILARTPLPEGGATELLSAEGLVLARHNGLFLMQDVRSRPGYPDLLARPEATVELTFTDGERRLTGGAAVKPLGWVLALGIPTGQALADVRTLITQVGGSAALAALVGLVLAFWLGRRTAHGMGRLRAAMSRLESGDIPANVPVTIGGEVGQLTEGFNRMIAWLRSRLQEYEAVTRVEEAAGAAIAGERTLDAVLPNLLRRIVGGMGADAGAIVTQEQEGLVTKAAVGFGTTQTEGVTLRRGQGLAGAVVAGREAVIVEDVEADYRVDEPYIRAAGIRSVIGVPILALDRVIGAVEIGYRAPHAFTEAEVQRLGAMARRTSQALEHERALGEVRRNTADLQGRLAEQMEALQRAAMEQAEARRQAQEAKRQAQELERTMKLQVAPARPDPAAEEAKRVRATLQKTVSEELRAPLTALLDLPRLLVDGLNEPLEPAEQQQLEILHSRGEEILELIDNLAILSAVRAGQLKVSRGQVSIPELVQRVTRGLAPRAATRGNRIETDIKPNVGQLSTDGRRLEQILANLLATSIKYTEVGEIRVTCYLREPDIVVTVADDGVGFTDEEQDRLFEPFLQVGPRDERPLPGTGLHLTVAQQLVQLLGGKIRVESEVDRGTWFTVSLPAQS